MKKLLEVIGGSHAYGTNIEDSDIDYRGIFIPPASAILGLNRQDQQQSKDTEANTESTFFSVEKFIRLAANCNPNVIEILFTDPRHVVYCDPTGQQLIDSRDLFLSKKASKAFLGYAISQLHRIKTHRIWLTGETPRPVTREEFGLPPTSIIGANQYKLGEQIANLYLRDLIPLLMDRDNETKEYVWSSVVNAVALYLAKEETETNIYEVQDSIRDYTVAQFQWANEELHQYFNREKNYFQAKQNYEKYCTWKENRNPARAALEAKYGYDCKHGAHLVRLLRMGVEILTEKTVTVYRPDREELIGIRQGAWSFDQLIDYADEYQQKINELTKTSTLKSSVNGSAIDELLISIQYQHIKETYA